MSRIPTQPFQTALRPTQLAARPASPSQATDAETAQTWTLFPDASTVQEEEEEEEEDDLDLLDAHLPDFLGPESVLPTHDGLGGFDDAARMARVEAWRTEHSRVLIDEIQRETRAAWHDDDVLEEEEDGVVERVTNRFLRDVLGIDDAMLEILVGETYVEDVRDADWQARLVDRVARELGVLVGRVSPPHPGAFSTYKRMQQAPIPYAGLPPAFEPTVPEGGFTRDEWERSLDMSLVFRYLRAKWRPEEEQKKQTAGPGAPKRVLAHPLLANYWRGREPSEVVVEGV